MQRNWEKQQTSRDQVMDTTMDLGKEALDLVKDTKEYLLSLRETGVAEVFREEPSEINFLPPLEKGGKGGFDQGLSEPRTKARNLADLREKIGDCQRCKLWKGRNHIVFGTGNPDARLLFVGEGPGEEEDRQGKPFVGRAGELLTKMIGAMGLVRDDVYIANVVKCRPPQNRNPEEDEITACRPFLEEQIRIIQPHIICALGTFAAHTLLETEAKISGLRGKIHVKGDYRIVPTFHPAYLLRNAGQKHLAWEDLQIIMKELGLNKG